jgi:hypothetical protein
LLAAKKVEFLSEIDPQYWLLVDSAGMQLKIPVDLSVENTENSVEKFGLLWKT